MKWLLKNELAAEIISHTQRKTDRAKVSHHELSAKVLGIDDFTGSLAVGKDATLFLSEGDALEMRGNILTDAFIQGRKISLETHQTRLWRRYSDKYKKK